MSRPRPSPAAPPSRSPPAPTSSRASRPACSPRRLGGVALTGIAPHFVIGTTGAVDYFTAKVGAHAAGAVGLSVTSGGVTKTFTVAQTGFTLRRHHDHRRARPSAPPTAATSSRSRAPASCRPARARRPSRSAAPTPGRGHRLDGPGLNVTAPSRRPATPRRRPPVDGACIVKVTTGSPASIDQRRQHLHLRRAGLVPSATARPRPRPHDSRARPPGAGPARARRPRTGGSGIMPP